MKLLHLPFIQKVIVFTSETVIVMLAIDKFSTTRFKSFAMSDRSIVCGPVAKHSIVRNGIRTM